MQQISDWLEKLGMSEYAQRFAENRIDLSVLPDLTDQHLKDLGVALVARSVVRWRAARGCAGVPRVPRNCPIPGLISVAGRVGPTVEGMRPTAPAA